jgi:hypothetical protein
MSIYFTYDYNCQPIEKFSGIGNLKTSRYYRVYGLRQEENPPVLLEFKTLPEGKDFPTIKKILKRNGIESMHIIEKYDTDSISIGLRKDLRNHISLSAAIVNTIIGYLEGKMNLNNSPLSYIGFKKIDQEKD